MEHHVGDMLVNLMHLPPMPPLPEGVRIKRAMGLDRQKILRFVSEAFPGDPGWVEEVTTTLMCCPSRCVIAVKEGQVIGFACWDTTAKDFFGPLGVAEDCRGTGVGTALLLRTLMYMRDEGYAYAVIGWVGDAAPFYEKSVGAFYIPGGEPENSVYSQMVQMP